MKTSAPRRLLAGALVTSLLGTSGCYDWVAIQPAELSKLQPGIHTPVARNGSTTLAVVSAQTVTAEDGTAVQIQGEYSVRLTTQAGKTHEFDHPVVVRQAPPYGYTIQGGNRGTAGFQLEQIKKVEVGQYNSTSTLLLALGLTTLASVVVLVALLPQN